MCYLAVVGNNIRKLTLKLKIYYTYQLKNVKICNDLKMYGVYLFAFYPSLKISR